MCHSISLQVTSHIQIKQVYVSSSGYGLDINAPVLLPLSCTRQTIYHRVQLLVLLFFTMYTRPLWIIAQRYGVKQNLYADDTQLYISLDPDNELHFSSSLKNLEHCIADIRIWMTQNLLKLNDNKTNISYLASAHSVKSLKSPALQTGASYFDQCINMHGHVTSVCRAAYYHLKNIHCLKAFLTQESLVLQFMPLLHLVQTIVTPCYMAYLIITLIAFSEFRKVQHAL